MSHPVRILIPFVVLLSACSAGPRPIAVAPSPPAVADVLPPAVPMPAGATADMTIPTPLADGGYPTPNRDLSPAVATWHLRVALNVAALACRGAAGDSIALRYNATLRTHAAVLKQVEQQVAGGFRDSGGDWRDRYDDAMTRLYNFFAFAPARDEFCIVADRLLDRLATVAPAALPAFAQANMATIDRPFTDFYRAYDAWRGQRASATVALAAAVPPAPPAIPRLTVDPAVFRQP